MKRYFLTACLVAITAIACAQEVIGESVIKLTNFTQEGWSASVTLKNTGYDVVTYIKYRIYYKDLKGNDIDYADYYTDRSIEPGLSRRFRIMGYGEAGEFIYNENKKNFQCVFEVREIRIQAADVIQATDGNESAEETKATTEQVAAKKAAEERVKREKAAALAGLWGGTSGYGYGTGIGAGSTSGNSTKGNTVGIGAGSGTSGSGKWSLAGRSLKGALAEPSYSSNAEGVVVVRIRVNAAGQVVEATLGQGTNTNDQGLIQAAIAAAKKSSFSAGNSEVIGSITYVFKLK